MSSRTRFAALLAAAQLTPLAAQAASTRTHVSNAGSDANTAFSCDHAHPCRTFAAALTETTPGGEILAIDSSGYGKVTIDRSVSIIAAPGVFAGIGVGSGTGVTIAAAGVEVALRGLTITGQGGMYGVNMTDGASLLVQDCTLRNFSAGTGLYVSAAARVWLLDSLLEGNGNGAYFSQGANALVSGTRAVGNDSGFVAFATGAGVTVELAIIRSEASNNTPYGISVRGDPGGGAARLDVKDSLASGNAYGVRVLGASGTAQATVSNSLIRGNSNFGLYSLGSGAKLVASGNTIAHNGTGMVGTSSGTLQSTGDNTLTDNANANVGVTALPKE